MSSVHHNSSLAGPGLSQTSPSLHIPSPSSKIISEHQAHIRVPYESPKSVPPSPSTKRSGKKSTGRIRITAVQRVKPDNTPITTYDVRTVGSESGSESGSEHEDPHHQELDYRAGQTLVYSTPPNGLFEDEAQVMQAPGAPRIPFPPSPIIQSSNLSPLSNIGLGTNFGRHTRLASTAHREDRHVENACAFESCVFPPALRTIESRYTGARSSDGLGLTIGGRPMDIGGDNRWEDLPVDSDEDEQAIYHLPSDLLSPDLVMSTDEFKDSLRRWMERRTRRWSQSTEPSCARPMGDGATENREMGRNAPGLQVHHRQSV